MYQYLFFMDNEVPIRDWVEETTNEVVSIELPAGTHQIYVRAVDNAYNNRDSERVPVTISSSKAIDILKPGDWVKAAVPNVGGEMETWPGYIDVWTNTVTTQFLGSYDSFTDGWFYAFVPKRVGNVDFGTNSDIYAGYDITVGGYNYYYRPLQQWIGTEGHNPRGIYYGTMFSIDVIYNNNYWGINSEDDRPAPVVMSEYMIKSGSGTQNDPYTLEIPQDRACALYDDYNEQEYSKWHESKGQVVYWQIHEEAVWHQFD